MDRKKWTAVTFPVIIGVSLFVAAVSGLYINRLKKSVAANNLQVIGELSEHDQNMITAHIVTAWESLEYMEGRMLSYDCRSLLEMETYMNVECANSDFTRLYMVSEDGAVYTDKYVVYNSGGDTLSGRIDLLPYFEGDNERIVVRYDDKASAAGIGKESILYGIRLEDFYVDGVKMIALAGMSDINTIRDKLVIGSFLKDGENRGYSAVIDTDGNYIVNVDKTIYLNQTYNFFDWIDSSRKTDLNRDKILEKMGDGESFSFYHTNEDGVKQVVYLMPFERDDIEWYFLMSVEYTAFTEQSREFLAMSMFMLAVILLVVVGLLYFVMTSQQKSMAIDAEAKARSEFMANMSHEIRTPLNGVIGLIQLMERDFERGAPKEVIRERLMKAKTTANYLLSLVNDILDMSKLQAGKIDLLNEAVSIELIVDAVCSMQRSNIEGRGIAFIVERDICAPWITGDAIRIEQILMNIVGNAAKFTQAGGSITFSVSQEMADREYVTTTFVCADTGCGMSEEFLNHIWDSFTQERNRISGSVKGTGLGLTISKLLADAMGGEISVESRLGEGSSFTVKLTSKTAEKPSAYLPDSAGEGDEKPEERKRSLKVLVAEDNELNAEILLDILEGEGFEVILAKNGRVAVEKFCGTEVGELDVVLMDMQMPEMDGCQAAAEIRRLDRPDARTVPIFACTANTFQEDRDRAAESGMNDFLTKPIDVKILLSKLGARR